MCETWVQSLGWEDPLEKGKATHSSILGASSLGLGGPRSLYTAAPLRGARICCGGAAAFFGWERLVESQES